MVSQAVYSDIWDGLLDVARIIRYFSLREKQFQRLSWGVRAVLALTGVGAAVTIFGFFPNELVSIVSCVIVAVVVFDLLIDPSKTVTQLKIVNMQLSKLEEQYRSLWEKAKADLITDAEAVNEKQRILLEMKEISSLVDIGIDEKINQIAQEEAFRTEENRYAQQT